MKMCIRDSPYIEQRAGEAVYSEEGSRQVMEQVAYYKRNAMVIYEGLKSLFSAMPCSWYSQCFF